MPPLTAAGGLATQGDKSQWRVTFDPDFRVFAVQFNRFAQDLEDAVAVWEAIADSLEDEVSRNFQTEGSSSGARWHPLSRRYAKWKAKVYPGRGILEATGALRESFEQGGAGHVREIRPKKFIWGSTIDYGQYHQTGGDALPRRPILRVTADTREQWQRIVHRHLVTHSRRLGRAGR